MKTLLLIGTLSILVTACDAPQRTRMPQDYINSSSLGTAAGTTSGVGATTGTSSGGTTGTTGTASGGSSSGVTTEPGFQNCDMTAKYYTVDTGFFGLCQSSADETVFKFRPTASSTGVRVCLVPTSKDASGASTYVGNPQCTYTIAEQVVTGKLYKDRQGFQTYPLNGVIVMKEPLLPEYIACMQGYVNWPSNTCPQGPSNSYCAYWLPRCPYGSRSNAACDSEGRNYMANLCNTFKSKYNNSYIDIRTK